MRLILMRHGETVWNVQKRLPGQENSALSDRGVQQALNFAPYVKALRPKTVACSDLGRAVHTAELIGHKGCPTDSMLREWHVGDWTGRNRDELIAEDRDRYFAWRGGDYTPPGAETWEEFRSRIAAGVSAWVAKSDGDLLLVVHGGVIRAALDAFAGISPKMVVPVTPGTGTILNFSDISQASAQLEAYNIGAFAPDLIAAD